MPALTCAALAMLLLNPASSGTVELGEDCVPPVVAGAEVQPAFRIGLRYAAPLVVEAGTHRVAGLAIEGGGNFTWRGGQLEAPGGAPGRNDNGKRFYAVLVSGADGVTLDNVRLTNARKGVVVRASSNVTLSRSRCDGLVEDCMIVANSRTIRFTDNVAGPFKRYLPLCQRGETISEAVGRGVCEASGGRWADGWHSDVLQLRDAVIDVVASGNRIATNGQGLTQMDARGDRPLADVRFENNIIASGRHGLTLGACDSCRISGNRLTSSVPGWLSVIRPGRAMACGNTVADGGPGRNKCAD